MSNFLKFLVLLSFTKQVYPGETLTFSKEEKFFDFLEKWRKSDSVDGFRSSHSVFAKQLMDTSVNPCEDFYNFACGNFESVLPEDVATSYHQTTDMNFHFSGNLFVKAIEADLTGDESEFLLKAKNFYRSCVNDAAWLPEVVGDFLRNFAKWPLLDDDWSEEAFDWLNVSAHAAFYGRSGLFRHKLTSINDTWYDGFRTVWIKQDDLETLKSAFKAVSINLDGKEDQLQEVLEIIETLRNLSSDYENSGDHKLFKASELEEQYPNFHALRFLKIVHDRDDLPSDTPVFVSGTNHFRRLNELVSSTDKRIMANFILSQLALNIIPDRGEYFLSYRNRSCTRFATNSFYFGLAGWFKDTYISTENQQQIGTLKKTLQDTAHAYFSDKKEDTERIYRAKDHIFFPLTTNVSDVFIAKYRQVTVDPNDFYSTWLQLQRIFKLKSMSGFEPDLFFKGEFTWLPIREGLLAPVTLFIPPFFHEHAPEYFKYGTFGSYLSHQFHKLFSDKQTYTDSVGCMRSLGYDEYENKPCAATKGVALALIAYKDWLAKDDKHHEVTDVELNGRFLDGVQGLLLSYAQTICVKRDEGMKKKISQAFSEYAEFRKAYSCD